MNEGKRRGTVVKRVHSFDQEICTYVWVTLCTLEKDDFSPLPLPLFMENKQTLEFLEWQSCHSFAEGYDFQQN